jgi:hypothetical protein
MTDYRIPGATGEWEVVIGLAIEQRAQFAARPER